MNLTETHKIRPNHKLYSICDELCFKSKNLYNAALFEFRQSYFDKEVDTLNWQNINRIFNQSNQFDYRELPSKVSNTVLKKLGNNISSFWSLVKKSDYKQKVRLPKYLHKTDGRFIVEFNKQTFSNKRDEDDNLIICKSSLDLRIPTKVEKPQQVRIIPKVGCYVIEASNKAKIKIKANQELSISEKILSGIANISNKIDKKREIYKQKKFDEAKSDRELIENIIEKKTKETIT
jgi:transposase, IS605 orfB family